MIIDNVYEMNGYADRQDYLDDLADSTGVDRSTVAMLADLLGESEDFDGLVTSLEDFGGYDE
jgi:DNA-binding MarR family transcriptional regulator